MKTQPNDSAFASTAVEYSGYPHLGDVKLNKLGLTKREHFAALAMQGLCVGKITADIKNGECVDIAECAIEIADRLIKALNKEGNK